MVSPTGVTLYSELHLHSNYSFQEGASFIGELVDQAKRLGYRSLALTDHDNLCGAVSFAELCHDAEIQPIIGCEVTLSAGRHLTLLAETRQGYGNLCWLISQAFCKDRLNPQLDPALLAGHSTGLIALSGCREGEISRLAAAGRLDEARERILHYRELFGPQSFFLELQQHLVLGDTTRNRRVAELAHELDVGLVATGNVHYHIQARHRLQDCLVAVRFNQSLKESHRERRANSEFYLKSPAAMAELFRWCPAAIENTARIAQRCQAFDLQQNLGYTFPDFKMPGGQTAQNYLEQVCYEAAQRRYGEVTSKIRERLAHEFAVIKKHNLAGFFLIYREVIQIAQEVAVELKVADPEVPIEISPPGRGRGSSVSMLVGYLIGISHIDPVQFDLSIERFLPDGSSGAPDIDLDFPRNIREELILRVHAKYGWERAALTGMISTYRVHGCIRDLGKALALPPDEVDTLAKRIEERDGLSIAEEMLSLADFRQKVDMPLWRELGDLAGQLAGFPRQLAQHPGGMVIASGPLTEIVPVQPSAIAGRFVMQWDKDSIETAGFVKIDFLGLGALSQIQRVLAAIAERHPEKELVDLSRIDFEDQAVYARLHQADTIGIFQVESAAQQQTITRLKPNNLTMMAHEVAAVRPGVGANDGVRLYIARHLGLEQEAFEHPLLEKALAKTHGVILFQDQMNEVARDVGGLSYREADQLRRAMAKPKNEGGIEKWRCRFMSGALAKGVSQKQAEEIFRRFNGHYMFPEAHAFAFGVTAYQLAWLKQYFPLEFYLGLFNEQPMGFYTPETLKQDAREHGVTVLNPDVNQSAQLCTYEGDSIRLGLSYVHSLGAVSIKALLAARQERHFDSLADLVTRSGLQQQQILDLIDAGALDALCSDRRSAAWEAGLYQPLGKQLALQLPIDSYVAELPESGLFAEMAGEYRTMGIHPTGHVMSYVRQSLGKDVVPSAEVKRFQDGERVTVAGLVIRRQRPLSTAVFITLEDEFGHIPLMVWPKVYAQFRNQLKAPFLVARGVVSRRDGTFNIFVDHVTPEYVIPNPPESRNFR